MVIRVIAPSLAVIRLVSNDQAKELTVSTDRLRIYHGGEIIFQPEDAEQEVEDNGDEFGEVLILPPAFHPVPPAERDIEEGLPLPASTEIPTERTENNEALEREERDERR